MLGVGIPTFEILTALLVEPNMVLPQRTSELADGNDAQSFVQKLQLSVSKGLPHAVPVPALRIEEHELVGIPLLRNITVQFCTTPRQVD